MTGRPPGAGYSGTPLPRKLGLKPGLRVGLVSAPAGFEAGLGSAEGAILEHAVLRQGKRWDIVLYFVKRRDGLEHDLTRLTRAFPPAGALWIAWPKRSSGVETDLTENILREVCLPTGMVDNKVCAIDEIWSGLRFVWRLENRSLRA